MIVLVIYLPVTQGGDVITEMLGMLSQSPIQTGHAKSIHHMITQLVQRKPSSEPAASRRPSALVYPADHNSTHRGSQISDIAGFSSGRKFSEQPQTSYCDPSSKPFSSSQERRHILSAHYGNRRHTLTGVPESRHRVKSSPPKRL